MNILILSATTGGGHMAAANALKDYILSKSPESKVFIYDVLEYVSPFINKAITGGYVYMAKNTPLMYGSFYKSADKTSTITNTAVELTTSLLENKLNPLLEESKPDIVITTHAFGAEIVSGLKNKGLINIPIISIVTDFAVHQSYISSGIDAYIVSTDDMIGQFMTRGVEMKKIYPFGIPVKQAFYKNIDRETAFAEEGLDPDIPTILIMAGSFGVTDILKIYHKIVNSKADFQVIVITGKNEKLYDTFEKYLRKIAIANTLINFRGLSKPKPELYISKHIKKSKPTKLLYYTNEVEKYMHMADLIVTKPGGLTITEAIASNLPMAVFNAIPGQEIQNADFLTGHNMAIKIDKNNLCTKQITELLNSPEKLERMKDAIAAFSKGNSAAKIYDLMLKLVDEYSE